MSNSNNYLLEQLKSQKGNSLSHKCMVAIQHLEQELQRAHKINQQQKLLIHILKEGKEYYQNQYKNNSFQFQFTKINQQNNQLRLLINSYRQQISKLSQNIISLQQQNRVKDSKLIEKQQELVNIQVQKQVIERQWNKVIKAVKRKISKLQSQNTGDSCKKQHNNKPIGKQNRHYNKQNETNNRFTEAILQKGGSLKPTSNKNTYLESSLHERALNMIQTINQKLAIRELQNLFEQQSQKSNKKQPEKQVNNSNMIKILGQSTKINELPFTLQFY